MIRVIRDILKIPELKSRILFSVAMLALYRVLVFIPISGVDRAALKDFFQKGGAQGTLFGIYDMFAGGALEQFSIIVLGIMPYITASIILQLMTTVIPHLENLSKEGEQGRRKITQYTRYGTILLAIVQGTMISLALQKMGGDTGSVVLTPGLWFTVRTVVTLMAGTAFLMWMGEQITERGIGNGISLIIMAGIVARLPSAAYNFVTLRQQNNPDTWLLPVAGFLIGGVAIMAGIVFMERAQRRIPIQHAKRAVGRKMVGGESHLPLKVNPSGVIPPIFASALLMFPQTIISLFGELPIVKQLQEIFGPGGWAYNVVYVGLIVFFVYFYTGITFNTTDIADNLKKFGSFVPGVRAGKRTAEYIDGVLNRVMVAGAVYLCVICVMPSTLIQQFNVPFFFGGTSLLIVVGVAMDTAAQVESHLLTRHYDGLLGPRGTRMRGRRG